MHCQQYCDTEMVSAVSYNFQKAVHRDILEYLGSIQWDNIFDAYDADEAAPTLFQSLGYVIEKQVPENLCLAQTHKLHTLKSYRRFAL